MSFAVTPQRDRLISTWELPTVCMINSPEGISPSVPSRVSSDDVMLQAFCDGVPCQRSRLFAKLMAMISFNGPN